MPGSIIPVHVIPKASANRIEGWVEDAAGQKWLKVRLTTAPEDGKANKSLLKLLAKEWKVPVSALKLVSGEKTRYKKIQIIKHNETACIDWSRRRKN